MKKVFYILILVSIISCKKEKTDCPILNDGLHVFYSEGSGWTGWEYNLTIDSTGRMVIHETKRIPYSSERKNKCKLLPEEVNQLKDDLNNLSRINLQDYGFGPGKPTDLPEAFFTYRLHNSSDSSGIYCPVEGEIPNELGIVLANINKLRLKYDSK